MMRNIKAFGLGLAATLVVSAITASAVSANQFHSASTDTTFTVASNTVQWFEYESGKGVTSCGTVGGSGAITAKTVTEVTFQPTYAVCLYEGLSETDVIVSMNGCYYIFTIEASANKGPVHLKCPAGKEMVFTVTDFSHIFDLCTFSIGEQTPSGVADYANNGSDRIDVNFTLTGIAASVGGPGKCGPTQTTTASLSGKVQLKGEITGQQTGTNIQVG